MRVLPGQQKPKEPRLLSSQDLGGVVIFQDDFERAAPMGWGIVQQDSEGAVALDAVYPFRGGHCLRITSANTAGYVADAIRFFGQLPNVQLGLEVQIGVETDKFQNLGIDLGFYDGAKGHSGVIQYVKTTQTWQYMDPNLAYINLSNSPKLPYMGLLQASIAYVNVKLVVDLAANKYIKAKVGPKTWDMRALGSYSYDSMEYAPNVYVAFFIHADGTAGGTHFYIDDVILTMSEAY